uniref:Uncharacterized protein n=1 Tax=viral metagenome TaxID=1070528 RepID=A0A6C0BWK6_9ZZZZ
MEPPPEPSAPPVGLLIEDMTQQLRQLESIFENNNSTDDEKINLEERIENLRSMLNLLEELIMNNIETGNPGNPGNTEELPTQPGGKKITRNKKSRKGKKSRRKNRKSRKGKKSRRHI